MFGYLKYIILPLKNFTSYNHAVQDLYWYRDHIIFDAFIVEHFTLFIKMYVRMTSIRGKRTFGKTIRVIDSSREGTEMLITANESSISGLRRDFAKSSSPLSSTDNWSVRDFLTSDWKNSFDDHNLDLTSSTNTDYNNNPIPCDFDDRIKTSALVLCGAMLTVYICDIAEKTAWKDVRIVDKRQIFSADMQCGPLKTKSWGVILVKAKGGGAASLTFQILSNWKSWASARCGSA